MLYSLIKKGLLLFNTGIGNYLNILDDPAHEYISENIRRRNLTYVGRWLSLRYIALY